MVALRGDEANVPTDGREASILVTVTEHDGRSRGPAWQYGMVLTMGPSRVDGRLRLRYPQIRIPITTQCSEASRRIRTST